MKLIDLLLEDDKEVSSSCDASNCADGTLKELAAGATICDNESYYCCTKMVKSNVKKYYCKKKTQQKEKNKKNEDNISSKCPTDSGYENRDFQEWYWKNIDNSDQSKTNVKSKLCGEKNSCDYNYAVDGKCGGGTKAAWKEKKDDFIKYKQNSQNSTTTTTTTLKPVDPEIQKFRLKFSTEWPIFLSQFEYTPDQWKKLYVYLPEDYPPVNFSILSGVTESILSLIKDELCRSKEFGLFNSMIKKIYEFYNSNDNGVDITDVQTRLGGNMNAISAMSQSIESTNNTYKQIYNFDFLTDPEKSEEYYFTEESRTVLETSQYLTTAPLKMDVWRYTYTGKLKKIDSDLEINFLNDEKNDCVDILDEFIKIKSDPTLQKDIQGRFINKIQDCFCNNKYQDLGKLSFKDKFNKKIREKVKLRLASLSNMGINKANCK